MSTEEEKAAFKAKLRSINFGTRGRTRSKVVDGYRPDGERCKHTTDELGHTVTESAERQDVHIRLQTVQISKEAVRSGQG